MDKIRQYIESLTPVLFTAKGSSVNIGISKRFFLFKLMNRIVSIIEEDPHLNFIALLKSYKVLGKFLNGTLHEFHRDRNKLYFKNFFYDRSLYEIVKADLEYFYPKYKDIQMTITKRGIIVYDNYKKNSFNILLLTSHAGTWVPEGIQKKLSLTKDKRYTEEDVETHKIYGKLVLDKGGIWVDNKQSRFAIDVNRSLRRAIYADYSEKWIDVVWKEELNERERDSLYASYREFYFTLIRLLESFEFNIIFDGHSMADDKKRPSISFGTKFIPKFYMPIVKSIQQKMIRMGYNPVKLNTPYSGGNILRWMSQRFPNKFIFSMEINKKLYMNKKRNRFYQKRIDKLAEDMKKVFEYS